MRIALVGCGKKKLDVASPAAELYTGELFLRSRQLAELEAHRWFVLSAKHGLVMPGEVIEPYELALADLDAEERRAWARRVAAQLREVVRPGDELIVLAGVDYVAAAMLLEGVTVQRPLEGLGFGERLHYLGSLLDAYHAGLWSRIRGGAVDGVNVELSPAEGRLLAERAGRWLA